MKGVQRGNRILALLLFLGMLSWVSVSVAQAEGDNIPARLFEAQGTMRYVDLPTGMVQIDNKRYQLAPNMKWYGLDAEANLMQQLNRAVNGQVAFVIDSNEKAPTVKAVWILPAEGR